MNWSTRFVVRLDRGIDASDDDLQASGPSLVRCGGEHVSAGGY
jgi:hypothetical protein